MGLQGPFGRGDIEETLFRTMQGFAALKGLSGTPNDVAVCDTVGRAHARLMLGS